MELNSNYEKHPSHYFAPTAVEVDDRVYQKYLVRFDDLFEIYHFLKSNPEVNREIFEELSTAFEFVFLDSSPDALFCEMFV